MPSIPAQAAAVTGQLSPSKPRPSLSSSHSSRRPLWEPHSRLSRHPTLSSSLGSLGRLAALSGRPLAQMEGPPSSQRSLRRRQSRRSRS